MTIILITSDLFRDGAMASLHCLWHGTTKDRKAIIKSLKVTAETRLYSHYNFLVHSACNPIFDDQS